MTRGRPREVLRFQYRNHRGETRWRVVAPIGTYFGVSEYYREPTWLLEAIDLERGVIRTFAYSNIVRWRRVRQWSDWPMAMIALGVAVIFWTSFVRGLVWFALAFAAFMVFNELLLAAFGCERAGPKLFRFLFGTRTEWERRIERRA